MSRTRTRARYHILPEISQEHQRSRTVASKIVSCCTLPTPSPKDDKQPDKTDKQTVLVLRYGDYRYIYSQNERTCSSFPVSSFVPFLIGERIVRRYWAQRCTFPVGVCTRPNQVSHQADEGIKKNDRNVLFVNTLLPHQSTTIEPPLGSWSVKKMNNSDNKVPVHNPDVGQSVPKRRRAKEKP